MNVLTVVLAYLAYGVALPAMALAGVVWLAPKTPGYKRRTGLEVGHGRR